MITKLKDLKNVCVPTLCTKVRTLSDLQVACFYRYVMLCCIVEFIMLAFEVRYKKAARVEVYILLAPSFNG